METTIKVKNAVIKNTMLGVEDHGILTFILHLDYGGEGQGAGLYSLGSGKPRSYVTMQIIEDILKIVGVDSWEELPGKHIRVKASHSKVYAIGNVLKDKWLDFDEFFNKEARIINLDEKT